MTREAHAPVRRVLRAVWARAVGLYRARRHARTREELNALSDRMLKDIGLQRADIDALFR